MKIAIFSAKSYDREYFNRFNQSNDIWFFETSLSESSVHLATDFEVVCVFVNDKIDEVVIDKLSKLGVRLIALRCAGYNNVDLNAAKKFKIPVVRVPAYSPYAVAEHAVALIMTLNRKTHKAYNRVREGNFSIDKLMGFNVHEKTVGVVGTGKIGAIFAQIMRGFGCRVIAFDIVKNESLITQTGVEYLGLDEVVAQSDILSLHCPLNDATRHIINSERLALMKPHAMLINTGRGGLIDTPAVIEALEKEKLGYLGIDVYEQEENLFFHDLSETILHDDVILKLMSFPNVLITAHQGFLTDEALSEIAQITFQNIKDFKHGSELVNQL